MPLLQALLSSISAVVCSAPAHLLCFSSLLGTELYQTFVVTAVTFDALPRAPFVRLQARLFPVYFRAQSLLLLLTAVTFPAHGVKSLFGCGGYHWIPLAVGGVAAALNLFVYGPETRRAMLDREHQGASSGGKTGDKEQMDGEMTALKRQFSRGHAMSIHLNLVSIGATLWHGWNLASQIRV